LNPITQLQPESQAPAIKAAAETADEPTTLTEVFEYVARVHTRPDTLNYKHDGRWIPISSADLLQRARWIAAGLYSLGIRRGERVAILSESRPEWTLTGCGMHFPGRDRRAYLSHLTPAQVHYILKDSGARVLLLANETKLREIESILSSCPAVEHLIVF